MGKHFDGRGHKTLDYFGMLDLYDHEHKSLAVLHRLPPHRYVCVPDVKIIVKKGGSDAFEVVLSYPGEVRRLLIQWTTRRREALWRLIKSGDLSWRVWQDRDYIEIFHLGRVIENKSAVDYSTESER
jgi:hypothetical protein